MSTFIHNYTQEMSIFFLYIIVVTKILYIYLNNNKVLHST